MPTQSRTTNTALIADTAQLMTRTDLSPQLQETLAALISSMRKQTNDERKVIQQQQAERNRDVDAAAALTHETIREQEKELGILRGLVDQLKSTHQASIGIFEQRIRELEQDNQAIQKTNHTLVQDQRAAALAPRRWLVRFNKPQPQTPNQLIVATNIRYVQPLLDCNLRFPITQNQPGKTLVFEDNPIEIKAWHQQGNDLYLTYVVFGEKMASYLANITINSPSLSKVIMAHCLAVQTQWARIDLSARITVCVMEPEEMRCMAESPTILTNIQRRNASIRALGEISVRSGQPGEMSFFKPKAKSIENKHLRVGTDIRYLHKLDEVDHLLTTNTSTLSATQTQLLQFKDSPIKITAWTKVEHDLAIKYSIFRKEFIGYFKNISIHSPHLSKWIFELTVAFVGIDAQINTESIPTDCILDSAALQTIAENASQLLSPSTFALR